VDSIVLEQPKTKDAAAILQKLSLPNKTLFILSEKNQNFQLAVRNLTETNVLLVDGLNVFDLLRHEKIVCTKDALRKIEERLN
jgi:large subunit ribosomal protein L4